MSLHDRRNARGRLLIISGIVLPIVVMSVVFLAPLLFGVELGGAPIGALVSLAIAGAMALINLGRRDIAPRASELRRKDKRPPIVYLRPFSDDGAEWKVSFLHSRRKVTLRHAFFPTYESRLARALKKLGPFIGVGDPREARPPLGASRLYVRGEDWQRIVTELLDEAALVVLHAGESEGVIWEVREIVGRMPPQKVILCLPLDVKSDGPDVVRWKAFCARTEDIFKKQLPPDVGRGEFVYFDEDWTPRVLTPYRNVPPPRGNSIRDRALRSLFDQFLHVSSPYALRALGKTGLFFVVTMAVILGGALSLNPAIDMIDRGTFGVFPTENEVIAEFRPRYDALRAKLARIASKLPPPGSAGKSRTPVTLDPTPRFTAGEVSNTAFVMEEQLLAPERYPAFSIGYFGDLTTALAWTAPDRLGSGGRAKQSFYETLNAGLATRYLVVHRVLGLEGTEPITAENFDKRALIAEGFLIDLRTEEIIQSWRLRAAPHPYKYRWDPARPYTPYHVTAEKELIKLLAEMTGGEFRFR